ncbi:hypothetical protein [Segniliparus rugosus]|uniref:Secreted protein n=1 Tax=Segniliparus rugosus (strain ATCC BAA-974 / DSM 45345 / CCUG 50838 / CIP 108380 / JCM 13579 / CDC 945) TaxID=679197 RepID=E5XLH5_SEGRC|nr:hypothetical protein [Segniliparus rugosus]EFV14821.2 hypothetical protein HMPREF9336_00344 [Segniliparus rugosus ATCC BAA-974]
MAHLLAKAALIASLAVGGTFVPASAAPDMPSSPCEVMLKAVDDVAAALKPYRQRIDVDGWSYDDPGMEYLADDVWSKIRKARLKVALLPDNGFPQWWTNLAHRYVSRASNLAETIRIRAMPELDREDIYLYLARYDDVATDVVGVCTSPDPEANF